MSACIGHTLSGNVLFSEGLLLGITGAIGAQLGLTCYKNTGCSNHSDKTEGVRLTETGDREPRSDQRHTKAEEEHPPEVVRTYQKNMG